MGTLSILNASMAGATQRAITITLGKNNSDDLKRAFGVGLSVHAVISVIVLLFAETLGIYYLNNYAVIPADRVEACFWVFQISVATITISILNVPFQGVIIAHERMGIYALFSIVDVAIKLLICVLLSMQKTDKLVLYAALLLVGVVINFLWSQLYCHNNFEEARLRFRWDEGLFKEIFTLAGWSLSGNIALLANTQGIVLIINLFFGPTVNAAFAVSSQATNLINQFRNSFQTAVNPQIIKTFAQENYIEMHNLIFSSSKLSYFLMLFFAIPLFYEAPLLLKIWLNTVPEHSVHFLRIGLFLCMVQAVRNPLVIAALASGNLKKYQSVVIGILSLGLPITFTAYQMGAIPETSAYVLLILTLAAVFASAYMLTNLIKMKFMSFLTSVIIRLCLVTIIALPIPSILFFQMDEGLYRLLVLSLLSFFVSISSIYFIGLSPNEKYFVSNLASKQYGRLPFVDKMRRNQNS